MENHTIHLFLYSYALKIQSLKLFTEWLSTRQSCKARLCTSDLAAVPVAC